MAISLVHQAYAATTGVTITTPTAGNTLIALVGAGAGVTISAVSGGGVTWVRGPHSNVMRTVEIWYGVNSSGSGTSITTTGGATGIHVSEWSGISNTSTLNASNVTDGATNPVVSAAITTTSANTLIITGYKSSAGNLSSGPTNGFTQLTSAANSSGFGICYLITSAIQTALTTTWTFAGTITFENAIAAFLAKSNAAPSSLSLLGCQ